MVTFCQCNVSLAYLYQGHVEPLPVHLFMHVYNHYAFCICCNQILYVPFGYESPFVQACFGEGHPSENNTFGNHTIHVNVENRYFVMVFIRYWREGAHHYLCNMLINLLATGVELCVDNSQSREIMNFSPQT